MKRKPIPGPEVWGEYIIRPTDERLASIGDAPNSPGIYAYYSQDGDLMYIGRSTSIINRLKQHRDETWFSSGRPACYSFRLVPMDVLPGVEMAHVKTLAPFENRSAEARSLPYWDAFCAEIAKCWGDAADDHRERVAARSIKLSEQMAERM